MRSISDPAHQPQPCGECASGERPRLAIPAPAQIVNDQDTLSIPPFLARATYIFYSVCFLSVSIGEIILVYASFRLVSRGFCNLVNPPLPRSAWAGRKGYRDRW